MKKRLRKLLFNSSIKNKALLLSVLCFFSLSKLSAQINYVPNPSFEKFDTCPYNLDNIDTAIPWDTLLAGGGGGGGGANGGELYANCGTFWYFRVPYNAQGNQLVRTGNAYSCQFLYEPQLHIREYFQVKLTQNLLISHQYCVTFYVSLCNTSLYACDHIGAYLDNGSIQALNESWVIKTPQVESPPHVIMSDTLNWMKIQGSFTATGAESYLTLGNFTSDSLTDTLIMKPSLQSGIPAFYYFDDVSVIESNSKINAGNDTTLVRGDTILLGKSIEGLPVEWYDMQGNLIANSSEIEVHPTNTTNYVVKMDLCGFVSYDTVEVKVVDKVGMERLTMNDERITVSPNPCQDKLSVSGYQLAENTKLEVSNLLGQVVFNQQINNSTNHQIQIDVSALSKGLYFIKATDEKGNVKNVKFVKE